MFLVLVIKFKPVINYLGNNKKLKRKKKYHSRLNHKIYQNSDFPLKKLHTLFEKLTNELRKGARGNSSDVTANTKNFKK